MPSQIYPGRIGLGFRVWGLGCKVQGLGFGFVGVWDEGLRCRLEGSGFRVDASGLPRLT